LISATLRLEAVLTEEDLIGFGGEDTGLSEVDAFASEVVFLEGDMTNRGT
jgi:hypothetical protein